MPSGSSASWLTTLARGEPGEHVAAEVALELLPAVLAVQADRADQADVLGRDAGPLEVVEQLGEDDTCGGRSRARRP